LGDISLQATTLLQLQSKQEEIYKKLQADLDAQLKKFSQASFNIINQTSQQFEKETFEYISNTFEGLSTESRGFFKKIILNFFGRDERFNFFYFQSLIETLQKNWKELAQVSESEILTQMVSSFLFFFFLKQNPFLLIRYFIRKQFLKRFV